MFEVHPWDMWDIDADYWVIPLNCFNVQGAGVALDWKKRDPKAHECYSKHLYTFARPNPGQHYVMEDHPYILAFTKNHWSRPSRMSWIANIVDGICGDFEVLRDTRIVTPALGCGYGGLSLHHVQRLMGERFEDAPFTVTLTLSQRNS